MGRTAIVHETTSKIKMADLKQPCAGPPFGAVPEREPRALWPRHNGCSASVRHQ
jgi:hypothetical protein